MGIPNCPERTAGRIGRDDTPSNCITTSSCQLRTLSSWIQPIRPSTGIIGEIFSERKTRQWEKRRQILRHVYRGQHFDEGSSSRFLPLLCQWVEHEAHAIGVISGIALFIPYLQRHMMQAAYALCCCPARGYGQLVKCRVQEMDARLIDLIR